jgi:hypothetical protein
MLVDVTSLTGCDNLAREHPAVFKVHSQNKIKYVLRLTQLNVHFIIIEGKGNPVTGPGRPIG